MCYWHTCMYIRMSKWLTAYIFYIHPCTTAIEPDDVTTCIGKEAVFTCVLICSVTDLDHVQWYRFIKSNSTTVIVDQHEKDINIVNHTTENTLNIKLTVTDMTISHHGYFWVGTPSFNVCNASLTVGKSRWMKLISIIIVPMYICSYIDNKIFMSIQKLNASNSITYKRWVFHQQQQYPK